MPFAVAFITNAGSSSDGQYESAFQAGYYAPVGAGFADPESRWLFNGGDNLTGEYDAAYPSALATTCIYVYEGWCRGDDPPGVNYVSNYLAVSANNWKIPAPSTYMYQSHNYGLMGVQNPSYLGASGDDLFAWRFSSNYFPDFPEDDAIDRLRFTFADTNTAYSCSYSEFANITFNGKIVFNHNGDSMIYEGFNFETSNKYETRFYDDGNGHWADACYVGFEVEFDFRGYESLQLETFIMGDWDNTTMEVHLSDFERDDGRNFADTPLPFAGIDLFRLSIEYQKVDKVVAGFIIRTGTLFLAAGTFAVGIASTRQWNPFKTFIGGILP